KSGAAAKRLGCGAAGHRRNPTGGAQRMMTRRMVGLAALAAALAAGAPALAQDDPIRIAALYNLTGGMSSIDAPALNGALLHAKLVNAAGGVLGGRTIEVVGIDTKTDQQEAATAAQRALSMDPVAGIGFGDTTFVMAAAPLFQAEGIPFVT